MVNITNGTSSLVVSVGAWKEIYKKQGYRIAKEEDISKMTQEAPEIPDNKFTIDEGEDTSEELKSTLKTTSENEDDSEEEFEDEDENDLSERPLSELSFSELRKYAEQLGLQYSKNLNKKQLKDLIKDSL